MGQPGGLADGSRWSPKEVGAATTGSRRRNNHAPRRGARAATTTYMFADVANLEVAAVSKRLFWHPSGVRELKTSFPVVAPPFFSRTTTGYLLATLRVGSPAGSGQKVQTPEADRKSAG